MSTYNLGRIGLNIRGDYDDSGVYEPLDVVAYHGEVYVTTASTTGNPPCDVDGITDTDYWQKLVSRNDVTINATVTHTNNITTNDNTTGNGELRYRTIGNHVYISGGVNVRYAGSNITLMNLPEGARPQHTTIYKYCVCGGIRIACVGVSTNGDVYLHSLKNITDGSDYTANSTFVDCNFDFWVD